ncbi:putative F-box domain-containing protein [Rosellinia necatrix]|uniref:Putative F-box domain-containing protein n=1 Tax=Rosellinia necatrix TaxID=77044 RepID=A0A1W2TGY7_ROSNE|nr:putative F-box domain-containing protein [Rosellinia necatrix]
MGIKPLGNQYFASGPNARQYTGAVGQLPDEMILHLFEYLDASSLRKLASTCRFLYAFGQLDDLWKSLFLESRVAFGGKGPVWKGTWKATYLNISIEAQSKVDCNNVFSDVLHRPFACSHIVLEKYASTIPASNNISRLANLSYDEFAQGWSNTPFILTDCIQAWPVCHEWNIQQLHQRFSSISFRAEAVDWPFSTYNEYMLNNDDESPLYLFDRLFAEKMNINIGPQSDSIYWPPTCFGPDLFEVLGTERPAHRWLIIGPARSGSTFHKDPNATSAWNAVVQGSKYWIMFPSSTQVPGVFVSEDSSEVTSPLSIAEWLLEFHAEARSVPGCIEGVCKAGEILHVPSGWWHLVVNLEAGIALTQNFVPKSHLPEVLSFLKNKPDQVTGFKRAIESPFELFVQRLDLDYPELLSEALDELDRRNQKKKRKWEEAVGMTNEATNETSGFSFGFAEEDEDEIP